MADPNYIVPENPEYDPLIRQLQDTDPASASNTFNPVIQRLVTNIHAAILAARNKAGVVVIPAGEDIPVADRQPHTLYLKVTDVQTGGLPDSIRVSPTMGVKPLAESGINLT